MPKQQSVGLVIFGICSVISARLEFYEPEPHVLTPAEERWGYTPEDGRTMVVLHGFRYYVWGIGGIGFLIAAEDYLSEKRRKKNGPYHPVEPTSPSRSDSP